VVWTYSWAAMTAAPGPDVYVQSHLWMKVLPMAPVFGADHSIGTDAGAAGQQLYLDYALMFKAVTGGCWLLAANPIVVTQQPATGGPVAVNAFTVGGGCTSPAVAGGNGPVGALVLFLWQPGSLWPSGSAHGDDSDDSAAGSGPTVGFTFVAPDFGAAPGTPALSAPPTCAATTPGAAGWTPLPSPQPAPGGGGGQPQRWSFPTPLPLGRGCVMVRCTA
jgi:hypothetical protein